VLLSGLLFQLCQNHYPAFTRGQTVNSTSLCNTDYRTVGGVNGSRLAIGKL